MSNLLPLLLLQAAVALAAPLIPAAATAPAAARFWKQDLVDLLRRSA